MHNNMNRRTFLLRVSQRSGYPIEVISEIFDVILSEIEHVVLEGYRLLLREFGAFFLAEHKGHKVQYSKTGRVDDYLVFKFSVSEKFNQRLREAKRVIEREEKDIESHRA